MPIRWPPTTQVFQKVPVSSGAGPDAQDDARFAHFKTTILPMLLNAKTGSAAQPHTAIFVPSYYDYVRVRNELLRREQVRT